MQIVSVSQLSNKVKFLVTITNVMQGHYTALQLKASGAAGAIPYRRRLMGNGGSDELQELPVRFFA